MFRRNQKRKWNKLRCIRECVAHVFGRGERRPGIRQVSRSATPETRHTVIRVTQLCEVGFTQLCDVRRLWINRPLDKRLERLHDEGHASQNWLETFLGRRR